MGLVTRGAGPQGGGQPRCLRAGAGRWWAGWVPPWKAGVHPLAGEAGSAAMARSLGGWAWPGDSRLTSWRGITECCLQHQRPCVGRAPRESDAPVSAPGYVPADSFSRRLCRMGGRSAQAPFSALLCLRAQSASWKSGVAVSHSALGCLNVSSTGLQAQTF